MKNDEHPIVSVVIPTYNRETFVLNAVESCLRDDYGHIEVVVVIDGSTDDSEAMLRERAESDGRIKVFAKKNGGVSDARNYGIERASGKYVGFLDDDDVLNSGALKRFVKKAEELGTDVLIGYNIVRVSVDGVVVESRPKTHFVYGLPTVFSHKDIGEKLLKVFRNSIYNKLIRRDLLMSEGIRFDTDIVFGEDTLFGIRVGSRAKRAAYIDDALIVVTRTEGHENMMSKRHSFDSYHFDYVKYIKREIDACGSIEDKEKTYIKFVLERLWNVYAKRYEDRGEYDKFSKYFREHFFATNGVTEECVMKYGTKKQIELYTSIMAGLPPPFPLSKTARLYLANQKLKQKNMKLREKNEALSKKLDAYQNNVFIKSMRRVRRAISGKK